MANEILGAKKYLVLANETDWGVVPGSPAYVHLPVTEYNARFRPQNRQANPYIGLYQRKHSKNFRGMVSGQLNTPLYGWKTTPPGTSLAQYLLDWSFVNHESTDLPSKIAEWAEGPNVANKRHSGLRVNSATLQGSDDSGVIDLSLDLMGKAEQGVDEVPTAQTLPDDRNKLVDFEFADAVFKLNTVQIGLKSFSLQVQHGLKAEYLNAFTPSLLVKTQRILTFSFVLIKNADTWDAYRRATSATEKVGQLILKGLHNGTGATGNWTVITIDLPRLSFLDADEQGGKEDLTNQTITTVGLKPDTTSTDLALTYSEAA